MAKPRIELDTQSSFPVSAFHDAPRRLAARVDGREVAACVVEWTSADGVRDPFGTVRGFASSDRDAGVELLRAACRGFAAAGATHVVLAAMDGWTPYAFAAGAEGPRYLGASEAPPDPVALERAGFRPVERSVGWLGRSLETPPDAAAIVDRVANAGLSLRPLDLSRWDEELDLLRALALEATNERDPVTVDRLRATERLKGLSPLDPEFLPIVLDRDQRPCGGAIAFVDRAPAGRNVDPPGPTLVVVNVFALPRVRGHGLGHHVLDRLCWSAKQRGCEAVVGVPAHSDGAAERIAKRRGAVVHGHFAAWEWRA